MKYWSVVLKFAGVLLIILGVTDFYGLATGDYILEPFFSTEKKPFIVLLLGAFMKLIAGMIFLLWKKNTSKE